MHVLEPGHIYMLDALDSEQKESLTFVKRDYDPANNLNYLQNHGGTTNQEVLRALIDRVKYLDTQLPCAENKEIIYHLRMALILHEARALKRKVEKGSLLPEKVPTAPHDLHFICKMRLDIQMGNDENKS